MSNHDGKVRVSAKGNTTMVEGDLHLESPVQKLKNEQYQYKNEGRSTTHANRLFMPGPVF